MTPSENHSTIKRDYEYKRLGTVSLLAGIDLQTGEAIPLVSDTHNSDDYILDSRITTLAFGNRKITIAVPGEPATA